MAEITSPLEAANLKLNAAGAIVDLVAVLDVYQKGEPEGLKKHTVSTAMLHVGELIDEVRELMEGARP